MRERPIDPVALATLVAVIEEASMTAAARRLAYSQSAVSMQIRRLEADLGVTLLSRQHGRVVPTRAGERALAGARDLLAGHHALRAALAGDALSGPLRFGLPADLAPLMRSSWARFAARFPDVEMQVRSALSVTLVDRLDAGALDLALLTQPLDAPRGRVLRHEPLVWVTGPGSRAHRADRLPLAIGPDGDCIFRQSVCQALAEAGRDWRIAYEGQTFATLAEQVAIGLAVTVATPSLVPDGLVVADAESLGLPALPAFALCLATGRAPPPAATELGALIGDAVR